MIKPTHIRLSDLRGFHRLASNATVGLTDLVEAMHHTIVRMPGIRGEAQKGRTNGITGLVYRSVRGVTRLVGGGVDALLALVAPLIAERRSSPERCDVTGSPVRAGACARHGVCGEERSRRAHTRGRVRDMGFGYQWFVK